MAKIIITLECEGTDWGCPGIQNLKNNSTFGHLQDQKHAKSLKFSLYLRSMYKYSFRTHWVFDAPLEIIWNEIRAIQQWPDWWKYVKSVTSLHAGDHEEIGSIHKIVWTSMLPYKLVFNSELVSMEYHRRIEGKAYGDLEGIGIWTFETQAGQTTVMYDWKVNTTKPWMKLLRPIAAPLFRWNHDKVMKAGYEGLKKRVQTFSR